MIWKAKKPEAVMVEEIDGKFRFVIIYIKYHGFFMRVDV
jgi:hypothetical protein